MYSYSEYTGKNLAINVKDLACRKGSVTMSYTLIKRTDTDYGIHIFCAGNTPVDGSFSGGNRTTKFRIDLVGGLVSWEPLDGSRTPDADDVLEALYTEILWEVDPAPGNVFHEATPLVDYFCVKWRGKKWSLAIDTNHKLSRRAVASIPVEVLSRLYRELLSNDAEGR